MNDNFWTVDTKGKLPWVAHAPFGWAVASESEWAIWCVDYRYLCINGLPGPTMRDLMVPHKPVPCSSLEEGKDRAFCALVDAMRALYKAIGDWQEEPEGAGLVIARGTEAFLSPIAISIVTDRLWWSTHSASDSSLRNGYVERHSLSDPRYRMANGIAATPEGAKRMARDSLAEVTEYRAEPLREWLEAREPKPAPETYLDMLRETLATDPIIPMGKPKITGTIDGNKLRFVIEMDIPDERFSVENKRIFEGPLFCHTCGLPAVPFGGEDICLDPTHDHEDHQDDEREDDDDDGEDEP